MKPQLDTIFINDLIVPCIIGVYDHERTGKQNVIINIAISVDTREAGQTDDVKDTVNYSDVAKRVSAMVENTQFRILEKLSQAVADICLQDNRVKQVQVHIEKPKALTFAKSSAIKITRYAK